MGEYLVISIMIDISTDVNALGRVGTMTTLLPVMTTDESACCVPISTDVLGIEDARRLARMFKALGDPTRVRLLSIIAARSHGEACACDLTEPVGLSQPTVSHHMKQLVEADLVTREQRGKWAYYTIVPETLAMLSAVLDPREYSEPGSRPVQT